MKINMKDIYIGTIKKCTKYEKHPAFSSTISIGGVHCFCDSFGHVETDSEIYKQDAFLIKVAKNGYVDLDTLNSFLDTLKIKSSITRDGGFYLDGLILNTYNYKVNGLFVDRSSLQQYVPLENKETTTVKKLKKSLLLDPRYLHPHGHCLEH